MLTKWSAHLRIIAEREGLPLVIQKWGLQKLLRCALFELFSFSQIFMIKLNRLVANKKC